ncbi:MAG: hypothetical protein OCC49_10375 [Fibrobacterales bacterium]
MHKLSISLLIAIVVSACNDSSTSPSIGESSSSLVSLNSSQKESITQVVTGTFTDVRDNNEYKYLEVNGQKWMAENLRFFVQDSTHCYDNSIENCKKYGYLYNWTTVMGIDSSYINEQYNGVFQIDARGICPYGWHVPIDYEWDGLLRSIQQLVQSSDAIQNKGSLYDIANALKSSTLWLQDTVWVSFEEPTSILNGNGTDQFGFNILPSGYRTSTSYQRMGSHSMFWTATEINDTRAMARDFDRSELVFHNDNNKYYGASVRCVEDK